MRNDGIGVTKKAKVRLFKPIIAILLAVGYYFLKPNILVDNIFTNKISKNILSFIGKFTSRTRINIGEILIYLIILFVIYKLLGFIFSILTFNFNLIKRSLNGLLAIISTIVIVFLVFWGFNYRAIGVSNSLGYEKVEFNKNDVKNLATYLIEDAKRERELIKQPNVALISPLVDSQSEETIYSVYKTMGNQLSIFKDSYKTLKPLALEFLYNNIGISGFFNPVTAESSYNASEYELFRYATMYHESAHAYGFAREDEASFVGYFASRNDINPYHRYSNTMSMLVTLMSNIKLSEPGLYDEIIKLYSNEMKLDIAKYDDIQKKYSKITRDGYEKINDTYLKINGQSGVKSYDDSVKYLFDYLVKAKKIVKS